MRFVTRSTQLSRIGATNGARRRVGLGFRRAPAPGERVPLERACIRSRAFAARTARQMRGQSSDTARSGIEGDPGQRTINPRLLRTRYCNVTATGRRPVHTSRFPAAEALHRICLDGSSPLQPNACRATDRRHCSERLLHCGRASSGIERANYYGSRCASEPVQWISPMHGSSS